LLGVVEFVREVVGHPLEVAEFRLHLLLAAPGDPEVGLVAGVLGHEDDDPPLGLATGPPLPLNRPDRGWDGFVEEYEVDLRDVQSLLGDRGGNEHLELARPELVQYFLLLVLGHPVGALAVALSDEPLRVEALAQELGERLRRVAGLGEDDHALAALEPQRLGEQHASLAILGVDLVETLGLPHGLADSRVRDHSLARLRRARRPSLIALAIEIPTKGLDALCLHEGDCLPEFHHFRMNRHPLEPLRLVVVDQFL